MQVSVGFNVRPLSIAYFIDDEDLDRFTQVALLACTQWGGMHSTFVPVASSGVGDHFMVALERHQPDLLVSACDRHGDTLKHLLDERFAGVRQLDWSYFVEHDDTLHAVALYPASVDRPSPILMTVDQPPVLLVYECEPERDGFGRACVIAAFGGIYPGQTDLYKAHFRLTPADLIVPNMPFLDHQLQRDPLTSPVNLTTSRIAPHGVENALDFAHFDVVLASTVSDLCWYWTKRGIDDATQLPGSRRVLLIPTTDFVNPAVQQRLFEIVRHEFSAASPHLTSELDINFISSQPGNCRPWSTLRKSQRDGAICRLEADEVIAGKWRPGPFDADWPAPRHKGEGPLTFVTNVFAGVPGPYLEGIDYTPPKPVEMHEGANTLYVPPRPPLPHNSGRVALDVESELWDRYPQSPSLARFVNAESRFTYQSLTADVWPTRHDRPWHLTPPTDLEAVGLYFADREHEATLGPAGRKAQALITLMGGIRECALLRDPAVFHLLEALVVASTGKLAQNLTALLQDRVEPLSDMDAGDLQHELKRSLQDTDAIASRSRTPSTLAQLRNVKTLRDHRDRLLDVLDVLVARRIVFRGVHVTCGACDTRSWHSLDLLRDFVTCPACFADHHLSVREGSGERPWEYRLNAAVNSALDQDVLPPILLLAKLFNERPDVYCPLAGIELRLTGSGNAVGDFDILYVLAGRLYAGECKAGSRLNDKDIDLARLAYRLGCAGFHFASLEGFDPLSRARIAALEAELPRYAFPIAVHGRADLLH